MSRYWFSNFFDGPFNFVKFIFCLIFSFRLNLLLAGYQNGIKRCDVQYMEGSLPESWYPERHSSKDLLVSCAPMGAPTALSEWDRSAPDTNSLLRTGCQWNPVHQLCYYTILLLLGVLKDVAVPSLLLQI
jgi:hypothetical protein